MSVQDSAGCVKPNKLLKCGIPAFDGLLPEPHNTAVLELLFTMAHWHGLAKLRLHTDYTLKHLEDVTAMLGKQLRQFQSKTCAHFDTVELKREVDARKRRQARTGSGANLTTPSIISRKSKSFNLNTYKNHALGDYAETIRKYGTSDLYSTELVNGS